MAAKKAKSKKKAPSKKKPTKPARKVTLRAKAKAPARKLVKKKAAPKEAARKASAAAKGKAKGKKRGTKGVQRQDRAGHLDPRYAANLRKLSGRAERDSREAFIKGSRSEDDLAQAIAEEVIGKATTGEDEGEDMANQVVDEERGGPFVVTTGGTEFADGVDESNPPDAEREPFPTT